MEKFRQTSIVQIMTMVFVLTVGSNAVAPEAHGRAAIHAVQEFYETYSVEIGCFAGVASLIISGNPFGVIKCGVKILSQMKTPGKPGAPAKTIQFNSVEEYLADPRVSPAEKELVKSKYLPALRQIEAEIQKQAKIQAASVKGKKVSEAVAEQRVRSAVQPLMNDLTGSLSAQGVRVIVK
jgi:hypothetical protein